MRRKTKRHLILLPLAGLPLISPDRVAAQDIARIQELGPAVGKCFVAPEGAAGSAVTLRFSLDKDGRLIGTPRITYRHLVGKPERQKAFLDAATHALQTCTPLRLSSGMAGAIAGQPIAITFGARAPVARLQDS